MKSRKLPNGKTKYFVITGGVTKIDSEDEIPELQDIGDGYIRKPFSEESIYKELSKKKA